MTQLETLKQLKADMELRGRSQMTIKNYQSKVKTYQNHFDKPADQMGENEVREFIQYQRTEKNNTVASTNTYIAALRFLYDITLDRPLSRVKVPRAKETRRIPDLPTNEELETIFATTHDLKYRAIFMTIYGSGLRVSEAANLRIKDIDSKNMRILIRHGKGDKDRYALLPKRTLLILREYFKAHRPKEWLFINKKGKRIAASTIQIAFRTVVRQSGIPKHITIHTLRHKFATELLNEGKNIYQIKKLMGHVRLDTTAWYLQLSDSDILHLTSPIDTMDSKLSGNPILPDHNG
jgi:site-specific recombinase XerD